MKKGVFIVLAIFLAFLIVYPNIIHSKENKIDKKVIEEIQKNEFAKVFINYDSENSQKKIFSKNNRLPVEENKIKYNSDNLISANISQEDLSKLESNPNVNSVTLVGTKRLFLDVSVPLVNATSSWNIKFNETNLTGFQQTVCILDTGVDFTHQDLQNKNVTCVIDCTGSPCVENCSVGDYHGHGTHVAGIVGANGSLKGVAPDVNLIGVKVCTNAGCADDDIIKGIDWCTANASQYNISVITMSLGGGQYSSYCDTEPSESNFVPPINNAVSKNISVIIATGNIDETHTNATEGIASPACIENATRVTASDDSDALGYFAFRHQFFTDILTAPGVNINSTMPTYDVCLTNETCMNPYPPYSNYYDELNGTSMSAPHVAGAFAIISQFKKIEKNESISKDNIKNALLITGKKIYDSNTSTNYSRIDIFSAIISLDESSPEINLISPTETTTSNFNQTFSCNATDSVQLSNLTLQIWNSSALYYENTTNATSNSLTIEENLTLSSGQYIWNCIASDSNGNIATTTNATLTNSILSLLVSPENNTKTNQNQTFSCTSSTPYDLSNVTFEIWNSSELIHNETKEISGKINTSDFEYNFTTQEEFFWNCLTYDNNSNFTSSENNFSITYDITLPNVTLFSPDNASSSSSSTVNFQYNVTDNFELKNCTLIIDNTSVKSNQSEINSSTNTIQHSLPDGNYLWKINCFDKAGNSNNSSTRTITINSPPPRNPPSRSSGSSITNPNAVITITEKELENTATNILNANQKLFIEIYNETYEFEITFIEDNEIIFTIANQSNILLAINQNRKINLNNDKFYDLEITLINITNSQAEIKLKKIYEQIPTKKIFNNSTEIPSENPTEQKVSFFKKIAEFFINLFRKIFEKKIIYSKI